MYRGAALGLVLAAGCTFDIPPVEPLNRDFAGDQNSATCSDGLENGDETDIDCGGPCLRCAAGQKCRSAADCETMICTGGRCVIPSCTDGMRNALETDIDCGGTMCAKCAPGKICNGNSDCQNDV